MDISKILLVILGSWYLSCTNYKESAVSKPIFNKDGIKIGDSVVVNDVLSKIIYSDTTDFIDSVIICHYGNRNLKSVNSFLNGVKVFENIGYYENGKIQSYEFISPIDSEKKFIAMYNVTGDTVLTWGKPFFHVFIKVIPEYMPDSDSIVVRMGSLIRLRIFHPLPSGFETKVYMEEIDGSTSDVLRQSEVINFMHDVSISCNSEGVYMTKVCLDLTLNGKNYTIKTKGDLIYTVIP